MNRLIIFAALGGLASSAVVKRQRGSTEIAKNLRRMESLTHSPRAEDEDDEDCDCHAEIECFGDDYNCDVDLTCAFTDSDRFTTEGAYDIFNDKTSSFLSLDYWIGDFNDGKQVHWLRNYRDFVFENSSVSTGEIGGCTELDADGACEPGGDWECPQFFDNALEKIANRDKYYSDHFKRNAFWIFKAVEGVRDIIGTMNTKLLRDAFIGSLDIGSMVEDLSGKDEADDDIFGWLAAAFTVAAGLGAANPVVSGTATVMAGVFSMIGLAGDDEPEVDISAGIESALGVLLERTRDGLTKLLQTALGENENENDYEMLPSILDQELDTNVGKFFDGGFWLTELSSDDLQEAFDQNSLNLQKKLVELVMEKAGWSLVADRRTDRLNGENCESAIQGKMLPVDDDDEEWCVYLTRLEDDSVEQSPADEDHYKAMADYGLDDVEKYFQDVIDCAVNGDGKKGPPSLSDVQNGVTFRCYYNMDVYWLSEPDFCNNGEWTVETCPTYVATQYGDDLPDN